MPRNRRSEPANDPLIDALVPQRPTAVLEEFRYDASQNGFWDLTTRPPRLYMEDRSVNGLIPSAAWRTITGDDGKVTRIKPTVYLSTVDNGLLVESSTWWPGQPQIIEGYIATETGVRADPRRIMINTYSPPDPPKSKKKADVWVNHVKKLWPEPKEHNFFFDYCAHMLQRPEEKSNSIVTLSGAQGIGKDMALNPIRLAVGEGNMRDISPEDLLSPYNPWVRSVMVVVNEMKPSKEDFHASALYEALKRISATPPDTIPMSNKYMKTMYVVNVMRIFTTTNAMTSLYIPEGDRRFFLMHSTLPKGWAPAEYFIRLGAWCDNGGNAAVANWLMRRNISSFQPKRIPDPTAALRAVMSGWGAPDEDLVSKILDRLGTPPVLFSSELLTFGNQDENEILSLMKSPRKLIYRMQLSGYFSMPLDPPRVYGSNRYKRAFIKQELMNSDYSSMLDERGALLASTPTIRNVA
jgi:hypothetical protein